MKIISKIAALMLCVALLVTCFASCHKKNETAIKIGDYTFSSGYYACALFFADSEARSKVESDLNEKGENVTDIDYEKQKIDGKAYGEYVKDKAIKAIKEVVAYKELCKANDITIEETLNVSTKSSAESYWSGYGYSEFLEPNGVSKETFVEYSLDLNYASEYFEHTYGKEDGTKKADDEAVKKVLTDNFFLVDIIEEDLSTLEDTEQKATKEKINTTLDEVKNGKSFLDAYNEYNGLSAADEGYAKLNESPDETTPMDNLAQIICAEDIDEDSTYYSSISSLSSPYFEDVKAMEAGEVKLIEKNGGQKLVLIYKRDISEDPYYISIYNDTLRKMLANDELKSDIDKTLSALKIEIIASVVDHITTKKITYPENVQANATA